MISLLEKYRLHKLELDLIEKIPTSMLNIIGGLTDSDHVIDLGANVGIASRVFAKTGAKVIAIEPNPFAFNKLHHNTKKLKNISVLQGAVTVDETREVELYLHESHSLDPVKFSSGGSLMRSKPNINKNETIMVKAFDLRKIIQNYKIHILKIDIEGYEVELIPWLIKKRVIERVNFIFLELHNKSKWTSISEKTNTMLSIIKNSKYESKFFFDWP